MSRQNDAGAVRKQYENARNLNTRISIHEQYSVNQMGFGNWIAAQYEFEAGMRILELGCGTGAMWQGRLHLLGHKTELVLTDFSQGMLAEAKKTLGECENVSYRVVDMQDIPFEAASFDCVIANMMLYHVPDLNKGLSEVRRVLKPEGVFYCATYGENGIVEYIADLLQAYDVRSKLNQSFTLQNGAEPLSRFFDSVTRADYQDHLEVTNLDDMVDYLLSLSSISHLGEVNRDELKQVLQSHMQNGVLYVPKEYGMFLCKKQ